MYREYQEIGSTILRLKQKGEVIIIGDFNAKLEIKTQEVTQNQSRNGKLLEQIILSNDLQIPTIEKTKCKWTRVNRANDKEKSVIDYIITTQEMTHRLRNVSIDDQNHLSLTGKKQSDHNTITCTLNAKTNKRSSRTLKIWAPGNKQAWEAYNQAFTSADQDTLKNYDKLEQTIIKNLTENIGKITIRGNGRRKESDETKRLRKAKRLAKKEYQTAVSDKQILAETKSKKKLKLTNAQKTLREHIQNEIKTQTQLKMNRLVEEGGTKSGNFWKIRKRILKGNENLEKYTKDEQGKEIKKPEEIKEHIANYYEQLYQAREELTGYDTWTRIIEDKISDLRKTTAQDTIPPFTAQELNKVIAKLKRNKATGPDNIPNTAFIEANKQTRTIILKALNHITSTKNISTQWQKGEVIRLYKGKGVKGKCSNERGITLSSNLGKLYERLINTRILKNIKISDEQAGGKKGIATTDHILRIKETIQDNKNNKHPTFITFLDVTKAYDKAWLDAIMYTMSNQGCTGALWNITDRLNHNLTANIRTSLGNTRTINIHNSIRQGGVLAVTQYATLMDEINKEIEQTKTNQASDIHPSATCLLWVDDVAIITNNLPDQKRLLKITEEVANRYRISFGKDKSKTMVVGTTKESPELKINTMEIDICDHEEMGTLDIQHRIILKRLNYYKRLQTKQEEAIKKIITNQHTNSWTTKTKLIITGIGLKDEDLIQQSTKEAKNNIKKAVTIKMKQTIKQSGEEKSKYTFLTTNKSLTNSVETDYLTTLTRNQARALFSARTRMTKAKANYKNMHATQTCRGCGLADETQQHILENCTSLHKDDETTVPLQDLFDHGNKQKTANTSNKLIYIEETLRQWETA